MQPEVPASVDDTTQLLALANLYLLVVLHGQGLEHAAIRYLAQDLGYTIHDLNAVNRPEVES